MPRIVQRRETVLSPWVTLVEKAVVFEGMAAPEVYHSVRQHDYVSVLAVTQSGRVPIVRQYRPAVETHTWEFPAGTVDAGESAAAAAARELAEEVGVPPHELHEIGRYFPDTGRLSLESTGFFARCPDGPDRSPEAGLELRYVSLNELVAMVRRGEFRHQLHVALLASAAVLGHITLGRGSTTGRVDHV